MRSIVYYWNGVHFENVPGCDDGGCVIPFDGKTKPIM